MAPRDRDQLGAGPVLDIGGVDDREAAPTQAHRQDAVEQVEGVIGGTLGAGIVGDHGPQRVRGEDLGGGEVAPREGALPAGGHPDQEDQRVGRNRKRGGNGPAASGQGGR